MRHFLILAILSVSLGLMAETQPVSPVNTYFSAPTAATFNAAIHYVANAAAEDSTNLQYPIIKAYLFNAEANRIAEELLATTDSLAAGQQFSLANLLLGMSRYEDAIGIYDKLNAASPAWSCPWRHKGEALYRQQDYAAAVKSLEKAIETNREHYDAYLWMALAQFELKNFDAARTAYNESLKLNPNAEESLDEMVPAELMQRMLTELGIK